LTAKQRTDLTVEGYMKVDAGTFTTLYGASTSQDLTVGGGIKNTGTLTANASTIIITGEFEGFALNQMGTFNAGTSTIQIGDGSTSTVGSNGTNFKSNNCHNLIINQHLDAPNGDVQWRAYTGTEVTIGGDLTVTKGKFRPSVSTQDLTVTGDVVIASVGQVGTSSASGSNTFGSLGIDSGGTYLATSGTTTITTGGTVLGQSATALTGSGTFTHNNGTLVYDSTQYRIPTGGTFYNVKMTGSHVTDGLYGYGGNLLPQAIMPDGSTEGNAVSILGTLEITDDEFRPYNINKIYIHNLIIGDGSGSANSAKFDLSSLDIFNGTVFVDNVTIHSDGQLLFGDGDETSATAGSSALNIYGAFRNLGGSVDIA
jgi:hypothetical protein